MHCLRQRISPRQKHFHNTALSNIRHMSYCSQERYTLTIGAGLACSYFLVFCRVLASPYPWSIRRFCAMHHRLWSQALMVRSGAHAVMNKKNSLVHPQSIFHILSVQLQMVIRNCPSAQQQALKAIRRVFTDGSRGNLLVSCRTQPEKQAVNFIMSANVETTPLGVWRS